MAKIKHCGVESRARVYRLPSSRAVHRFEHVQQAHCKICAQELMQWRGEYRDSDERFTFWIAIEPKDFETWKRRIKAGEAKPEAQLTSEWAERVARPADLAIYYHNTIQAAQRYCFPR